MEEIKPLLKKPETSRVLNVCERTVDYLVSRNQLKCVKIGSAVRFKTEDIQAFIESQRKAAK